MTLGERIKSLRKSQKLTLATLAGDEITKGMLSLIENDKSKPSMETLQHLAKRLDVSIGYLTQEGDEEWTRKVLQHKDFKSSFSFPYDYIQREILPNLDKVSQNSKGMDLYHIIRIYHRYKGEYDIADEYTEKISNFYKRMGMEHLAVRNLLNDSVSFLYSQDYEEGYKRLINAEADILEFKAYDSRIELDYLYQKAVMSVTVDMDEFVRQSNKVIEMSYEMEDFRYFYTANLILGYYYGLQNEWGKYEVYRSNLLKYIDFNRLEKYKLELLDEEQPFQVYYVLVEDVLKKVHQYKAFIKKIDALDQPDDIKFGGIKFYRPIFTLEALYFSGDYDAVMADYRENMYIRSAAQHPIDRIIMATRSCIYPLSLHYTGRTGEAKQAFNKIEETIEDIKDSVFTKEFYMIRDIIFAE